MTKKKTKTGARSTAHDLTLRAEKVANISAFIESKAVGQERVVISLWQRIVGPCDERPERKLGVWDLVDLRDGESTRVAETIYGLADGDHFCREATQHKYIVLSYHGDNPVVGPDGELVFEIPLSREDRKRIKYKIKLLEEEKAYLLAVLGDAH